MVLLESTLMAAAALALAEPPVRRVENSPPRVPPPQSRAERGAAHVTQVAQTGAERPPQQHGRRPKPNGLDAHDGEPSQAGGDAPRRPIRGGHSAFTRALVPTRRKGRYGTGKAGLSVCSGRRAEKADTGRAKRVYAFARADAPRRPIRDGQSAFTRSLGPTRREGRYGTGKARLRVSSGRRAEKADTGRAKQVYPFARADAPRGPIRDGQSAFTR